MIKTWEWVAETPRGMGGMYPHIIATPDGLIFLKRGASTSLSAYDVDRGRWEEKSPLPESYDSTGTLFDYDSYHQLIWYIPAGGSRALYSYSPRSDSWRSYPPAPDSIGDGAVIFWGGESDYDHLYVLRGSHGPDLYRFTISGQRWEAVRTPPFLPTSECTGFRIGSGLHVCPNPALGAIYRYDVETGLWALVAYTSLYAPSFAVVDGLPVAFSREMVEIFSPDMSKKRIVIYGRPPVALERPRHPTILPPPFPTAPTRQFDVFGEHVYAVTGYGAEGNIFRLEKALITSEKPT
ncbi:MAG: hypothetical protein BA066_07330 [Candidatus Korarchaeota archaeon NZ13-K]|nr:MAG: hypothetical protein BA066_07330 [Candidatus Korarchaeota archaeon NZ13-K]